MVCVEVLAQRMWWSVSGLDARLGTNRENAQKVRPGAWEVEQAQLKAGVPGLLT